MMDGWASLICLFLCMCPSLEVVVGRIVHGEAEALTVTRKREGALHHSRATHDLWYPGTRVAYHKILTPWGLYCIPRTQKYCTWVPLARGGQEDTLGTFVFPVN